MRRYRDLLLLALLLLLPLVVYLSHAKSPRERNAVDGVVVWVTSPVQWLVASTLEGVAHTWQRYVALVGVERENEVLRRENAELRRRLAETTEARRENERLKRLLGIVDGDLPGKRIAARVIAVEPTPLFRSVRVNRGKEHGVRRGAPVINDQGVVGRVVFVGSYVSDVMLLVDPNSSLDVLVARTRARARARGAGRDGILRLDVQYLPRTAPVDAGDVLITSGTGGIFPKGLVVGRVTEVEKPAFGLYQRARAEPSVDFARLEEVVLLVPDASVPPSEVSAALERGAP